MSMKFNARGTTNVDWFTQNNLLQSPWTDLKSAANIFPFRINGHFVYLTSQTLRVYRPGNRYKESTHVLSL